MAVDWKKIIGLKRPFPPGDMGSTGMGPDWPDNAGDRERGKFRESAYPRLTQVAVTNDDGSQIGANSTASNAEMLLYLRAIALGLSILTEEDLVTQANKP